MFDKDRSGTIDAAELRQASWDLSGLAVGRRVAEHRCPSQHVLLTLALPRPAPVRQVLKAMGHFPTPVELADLMERMDTNQVGGRSSALETRRLGRLGAQPSAQPTTIFEPCSTAAALAAPLQDGVLEFGEFADAMLGQAEDEEMERQLEEVRRCRRVQPARCRCHRSWLCILGKPAACAPPSSRTDPRRVCAV